MRTVFQRRANLCACLLIELLPPFCERHPGQPADLVSRFTDIVSSHVDDFSKVEVKQQVHEQLLAVIVEHLETDTESLLVLSACLNASHAIQTGEGSSFGRAIRKLRIALCEFKGEDFKADFYENLQKAEQA